MPRFRLNAETAQSIADTLHDRLADEYLAKIWRPSRHSLLIQSRALQPARLTIQLKTGNTWLALSTRWGKTPAQPDRETLILRKFLEGARVSQVSLVENRWLRLDFYPRRETHPTLLIQLAGRYPNISLFDRNADFQQLMRLIPDRPPFDPDSPPLRPGPLFSPPPSDASTAPPSQPTTPFEALSDFLWAREDRLRLENSQRELQRLLQREDQRLTRQIAQAEAQFLKAQQAERLRHQGELLRANLYQVQRGMSELMVLDWESGQERRLDLDPALSPQDNLARAFQKYRKAQRSESHIQTRIEGLQARHQAVTAFQARLDRSESQAELDHLSRDMARHGLRATQPKAPSAEAPRLPYRTFTAGDGSTILVGRTARDNDRLTFQHARGSDLFLHTKDAPGSHVILRRQGRQPFSEIALIDAAILAAHHSPLRDEAVIEVLYIEKKHVRKPPKSAPGLVQMPSPKSIAIRIEPERLKGLYATQDQ